VGVVKKIINFLRKKVHPEKILATPMKDSSPKRDVMCRLGLKTLLPN